MKVSQFKILIDELKSKYDLEEKKNEVIKLLVSRLKKLFELHDDEDDVQPQMMAPVYELINEFWRWSTHHLSYEQWQSNELVAPWLIFQKKLVKKGMLERDFHHPILYEELKNRYDSVPETQLSISEFMPLLIRASRMLGYASIVELDNYPLERLSKNFSANYSHEVQKLKEILFLLQTSFYLLYNQCTVGQIQLIPYLIDYRYHTTDEERRSERAIVKMLTQKTTDCLDFFRVQEAYIDTRALKESDALSHVAHLIPNRRSDFLQITNDRRWIYHFIQKSRIEPVKDENDLLNETLQLLEDDFHTRKDQSYMAALEFISTVKKQMHTLTNDEAKIVHPALTLFAFDQYIKQRQEDKRPKHSFLSLSGKTKCRAAEKWKSSICGAPVNVGFFERMALNQGRLRQLMELLDNEEQRLEIN